MSKFPNFEVYSEFLLIVLSMTLMSLLPDQVLIVINLFEWNPNTCFSSGHFQPNKALAWLLGRYVMRSYLYVIRIYAHVNHM